MKPITLSVEITADRKLIVELPPDTPIGKATLVVVPENGTGDTINPAREAARAKLAAAGILSTASHVPNPIKAIPDDELLDMIQLPPGSPSILDMINEDRGDY
jgi:hypothetical protein